MGQSGLAYDLRRRGRAVNSPGYGPRTRRIEYSTWRCAGCIRRPDRPVGRRRRRGGKPEPCRSSAQRATSARRRRWTANYPVSIRLRCHVFASRCS
jgi:hypothetical protein